MKKIILVAFTLLFAPALFASELTTSINNLESAWAQVYYQPNESLQRQTYPKLLSQAEELVKRYPYAAEPKIWLATIVATNAAFESSLTALSTLEKAKALLEQSIEQNPNALEGAAFVTLGTLYYMVPGWPVSFGDNQIAEQMLQTSLKINPNGIDANYFYADYLLQQGRDAEALTFFNRAIQSPVRKNQAFADSQLQNEAKLALANTQQRKFSAGKSKFMSLFTTASSED